MTISTSTLHCPVNSIGRLIFQVVLNFQQLQELSMDMEKITELLGMGLLIGVQRLHPILPSRDSITLEFLFMVDS